MEIKISSIIKNTKMKISHDSISTQVEFCGKKEE